MTGLETFRRWVPTLLQASATADRSLMTYAKQAVSDFESWELPTALTLGGAWAIVLPKKLETPNQHITYGWRVQNSERKKWEALVWMAVTKALGVASRAGLTQLGRAPHCDVVMALQIVRLVPSSREFIRDDDNLEFSGKRLRDALSRVGLIKDDSRRWIERSPVVQDVSPIGLSLTLIILRPAAATLLEEGVSDVHGQIHSDARGESRREDRRAQEGRAISRAGHRAGR